MLFAAYLLHSAVGQRTIRWHMLQAGFTTLFGGFYPVPVSDTTVAQRSCYLGGSKNIKARRAEDLDGPRLMQVISNMCVLTKYLHLCGHETGGTIWTPEDPVACPLTRGARRCSRPRVRYHASSSYCTAGEAPRGRLLSQCRRKAFREHGWICHECGILNVPAANANCLLAFSCAGCGAKDNPLSRLPSDVS